jgi:hypothetical protein
MLQYGEIFCEYLFNKFFFIRDRNRLIRNYYEVDSNLKINIIIRYTILPWILYKVSIGTVFYTFLKEIFINLLLNGHFIVVALVSCDP